jgi:predicted permease
VLAPLRSFLRAALHRNRFEREMQDELQHHRSVFIDDQVARGVPRAEAEIEARRTFGFEQQVKEECRESRGLAWVDGLHRDLVYALRMLRRNPAFTATAILSLALGIGANTAIFGIIDALILRPLPVSHPEQLVILNSLQGMPFQSWRELRRQSHSLSAVIITGSDRPVAIGHDGAVNAGSDYEVSANFFSELGVRPAVGRLLSAADDAPQGIRPAPVVVLSYRYWQREFQGDPNITGKTLRIETAEFTIIGVSEKRFTGTYIETSQDVTTIIGALDLANGHPDPRLANAPVRVMARLASGITEGQSQAELNTLWPGIVAATSPSKLNPHPRIDVQSGQGGNSYTRTGMRPALASLMGLSAVVLFIACLNLANLMLARAAARTREFGIRTAIGAGRGTLIRQMLTESSLLSISGTIAGFALGNWMGRVLAVSAWRGVAPLTLDFSPDTRTIAFTILITVACTLLTGLLPALRISRTDPAHALHAGAGIIGGRTSRWTRVLTVLQVALSLILVTAAGLFARTLENLQNRDYGFSRSQLLVTLKFAYRGPPDNPLAYWQSLQSRLLDKADVAGVAMSTFPLVLSGGQSEVNRTGTTSSPLRAYAGIVTPGFFHVLGLPLLQGRDFTLHDDGHTPAVAIVSETLARRLFPGQEALGRRIDPTGGQLRNVEIVGIVHDTLAGPRELNPSAALYLDAFQMGSNFLPWLTVRTHGEPAGAAATVRAALSAAGREYPFFMKTGPELNAPLLERMIAGLAAGYAGLALLLAAIGLYGTVSYGVNRRTAEIGVRLALGAQRTRVVRLFLSEIGAFLVAGLVLGTVLSLAAGHTIAALLFGVQPGDPLTFGASALILIAIGASAAYLPARRAARLDPAAALRCE